MTQLATALAERPGATKPFEATAWHSPWMILRISIANMHIVARRKKCRKHEGIDRGGHAPPPARDHLSGRACPAKVCQYRTAIVLRRNNVAA